MGAAPLLIAAGWTQTVTAVGTGVVALVGFLAVLGYAISWRSVLEGAKARQTQVYKDIALRWDDDDLIAIRATVGDMTPIEFHTYYRGLEADNSDLEVLKIDRLANYFEDLGVLESLKSIDIQWIEESLSGAICNYWGIWELVTVEDRGGNLATPTDQYQNWESLTRKIQVRRQRREFHHPSERHRRKHF